MNRVVLKGNLGRAPQQPCLVNYVDRTGRSIANDKNDDWLAPACAEMLPVLRNDSVCISFNGWNRVDRFFAAWRAAGFRAVGHIVFAKQYESKARFLGYRLEAAYLWQWGGRLCPVSRFLMCCPGSTPTTSITQADVASLPAVRGFTSGNEGAAHIIAWVEAWAHADRSN